MNLIELGYLTLSIICAWFLGSYLAARWGIAGWLIGAPLGLLFPKFGLRAILRMFNRAGLNREKPASEQPPENRSGHAA